MTEREFVYWLKGILDSGVKKLGAEQFAALKENLYDVIKGHADTISE
jgi:hypothetical protein